MPMSCDFRFLDPPCMSLEPLSWFSSGSTAPNQEKILHEASSHTFCRLRLRRFDNDTQHRNIENSGLHPLRF